MDKVSFQNGFLAGMATKGLVKSGQLYKPTVWNDSGIYSYFYIDFRRAVAPFSLGMFNESVLIYDSAQLLVTKISAVSTGVYMVSCDISNKYHGITVLNKATSRLRFASGEHLPVFSTHFYVAGVVSYLDGGYTYEPANFSDGLSTVNEALSPLSYWAAPESDYGESDTIKLFKPTATESPKITLK